MRTLSLASSTMKFFFVSLMAVSILGQNFPSADEYLVGIQRLIPSFDKMNQFDGPKSISSAPITTSIDIPKPTREEMMYYNYYAISIYSVFGGKSMDCIYCAKIKDDMDEFIVLDNSTHDTSALVALSGNRQEIVVAYRGSMNVWNILLDIYFINTSPDRADHIKIHKSFFIAVMSLYDRVVEQIDAFRSMKDENINYKLVITGQSLGGAMARITQFMLLYLNRFPEIEMEVYTYGEPRSGNKNYVDFLNSRNVKSARVTNRADMVCHMPPTSVLGTSAITDFYYHALTEYWIDDDREVFANQSMYEDPNLSISYGPRKRFFDHFRYFDVNYFQLLTDAHEWLAIPGLLHPVDVFPAFPKPVQTCTTLFADLVANISNKRTSVVKSFSP